MNAILLIAWLFGANARLEAPCRGPASTAATLVYGRTDSTLGITIKAPRSVDPAAVAAAQRILGQMLHGRADIRTRLVDHHAALAIIPRACYITALPEFAALAGKKDPNANAYDSFAIRGAGAVPGQPVTATSEENLLKLSGDPFSAESVTHHEFAHAIMNLGFTQHDRDMWNAIFRRAVAKHLFPGAFAMTSPDEYWAELSQSYFSVNNEINGPAIVHDQDPAAAAFLAAIYGPLPSQPPPI
jgi:hypothetical protein